MAYQLRTGTLPTVFENLRSVQFDPLSPVGCNHDLVLQARVPGYKVGDWEKAAYKERLIYDGWDKMASLVPYTGWHLRRIYHQWHGAWYERLQNEYPSAVEAVLRELEAKGPVAPRDLEFQEHRPEWKGSWYGPSLTKNVLRALWHSGLIMTHSRRGNQHVYDLTERVVPPSILDQSPLDEESSIPELLMERARALGFLRPTASYEIWSLHKLRDNRKPAFELLLKQGSLLKVDIEGVTALVTPEFLNYLDAPVPTGARFIAPLDQLVWDRKLVSHLFGFEYLWEVYVPEHKRKWGYYVLPVVMGDKFVARADLFCRSGVLEVRAWHWEPGRCSRSEVKSALKRFMKYCRAEAVTFGAGVDEKTKEALSV